MNNRVTIENVKELLVKEARRDVVGLWAVLWDVKERVPSISAEDAKQATLTVIREALYGSNVVAGVFAEQNGDDLAFERWNLPHAETVARIDREWSSLGREPTLGEVVWFVDVRLLPVTARKNPMGDN